MKRQGGFTLIEMIVVIVILGILAVTAAPKFLSFTSEARTATLKGVEAAIQSAANITHGKHVLGQTVTDVTFVEGYPSGATVSKTFTLSGDMTEFDTAKLPAGVQTAFGFTSGAGDLDADSGCYVGYVEATSATGVFSTKVVTTGCN
ncbi:type II secretion system protein [Enterovibrio norvegicus]|uniref:Type II secretion system protein n=1 Tax=Enterovibrio norvegicus TaxID=188144 RepID=A0ABV4KXC8_9GAMM|nr:type II secretion system protein [Enterovibrio norvegicus]OEF57697.1 hypothetical protein A1OU_01110 [Enterovibrio norvegicus]TKF32750.1 type II secretion system protein [Enterovibrio norvegicus]